MGLDGNGQLNHLMLPMLGGLTITCVCACVQCVCVWAVADRGSKGRCARSVAENFKNMPNLINDTPTFA